jgi:hypothetical protein
VSKETALPPRKKAEPEPVEAPKVDERGPLSPAQHEDDGWGDTPVQMRG